MMKLTLTLLVCALTINYATCGLVCRVGTDEKLVATDCSTLTRCYTLVVSGTTDIIYGCDDPNLSFCIAARKARGGSGKCVGTAIGNVAKSCINSASDIAATKLMVIPALVLIFKRFF